MKRTVVIGASRRQFLPAKVCEWTIRSTTPGELDIIHTYDREYGSTPFLKRENRTGFSFVRFAVPELAEYKGRAVYVDSDMMVLADMEELFCLPMNGASVLRPKNQTAVLLYECAMLSHWRSSEYLRRLEMGDYKYADMLASLYEPGLKVGIPPVWNHLDEYQKGHTKLLHYTDMATQPWLYERHQLADMWYEKFRETYKAGLLTRDDIEFEIRAQHVGGWLRKQLPLGAKNA